MICLHQNQRHLQILKWTFVYFVVFYIFSFSHSKPIPKQGITLFRRRKLALLLSYNEIIALRLNYIFFLSKLQLIFIINHKSLLTGSQMFTAEWSVILQLHQFCAWVQLQVITSYLFVNAHESLHVQTFLLNSAWEGNSNLSDKLKKKCLPQKSKLFFKLGWTKHSCLSNEDSIWLLNCNLEY